MDAPPNTKRALSGENFIEKARTGKFLVLRFVECFAEGPLAFSSFYCERDSEMGISFLSIFETAN